MNEDLYWYVHSYKEMNFASKKSFLECFLSFFLSFFLFLSLSFSFFPNLKGRKKSSFIKWSTLKRKDVFLRHWQVGALGMLFVSFFKIFLLSYFVFRLSFLMQLSLSFSLSVSRSHSLFQVCLSLALSFSFLFSLFTLLLTFCCYSL